MFAYCNNNPIVYKDIKGEAIETVFDVVSLSVSAVEVLANPTDLSAWAGLLGDTVDLIPFVTGVGETIRALKVADKIADGTDAAIDSYRRLKKAGSAGKEVHHIVEKRFAKLFGYGKRGGSMPSIALSPDEHRMLTNLWRDAVPYGSDYTVEKVVKAAAQVYSDNPRLMGAAIYTMIRNVK
jgi:hypothetical protein